MQYFIIFLGVNIRTIINKIVKDIFVYHLLLKSILKCIFDFKDFISLWFNLLWNSGYSPDIHPYPCPTPIAPPPKTVINDEMNLWTGPKSLPFYYNLHSFCHKKNETYHHFLHGILSFKRCFILIQNKKCVLFAKRTLHRIVFIFNPLVPGVVGFLKFSERIKREHGAVID